MRNQSISLQELALMKAALPVSLIKEARRSKEVCFLTRNVYQNWLESFKKIPAQALGV